MLTSKLFFRRLLMLLGIIFIFSITSCNDNDNSFTPTPVILNFSPDSTKPNKVISVLGGNFDAETSLNIVKFTSAEDSNGNFTIDLEAEVIQAQENALSVRVPLGAITGPITVTVNGELGTSPIVEIIQLALTITEISPASANRGDTVTITGQDFSEIISENVVTFGAIQATVTSASSTSLEVIVPQNAELGNTTVKVSVTSIQEETTSAFEVTDTTALSVLSYSPSGGSIGAEVTIFGANFSDVISENTVSFNGINATVSAATTTSLTVVVPNGVTSGPISVTVNGVTATGPDFTVTFSTNDSSTSLDLLKVFWLNDTIAYIVGDDGTLLKTTDSGATWTADTVIPGLAGTDDLYNVFFIDENTGWATTRSGVIYKTSDAGGSWTEWEDDDKTKSEEIRSIIFVDANTGWASGDNGIILHTTDGGSNWDVQAATFNSGTSTYTYDYDTLDFDNIFFSDANNGWAVAEKGTIISTTDGGSTWIDHTNTTLQAADIDLKRVIFTDANNGWVVGEQSTILNTTDGGSTWNTITITGNLPSDIDINYFEIVNNNLIIAVTDDAGLIQSFDGGTTFSSSMVDSGIISDSTLDLEGIAASPSGKIIIVGDDGVLLK
ncbi:YCF48-related protein [Formosa sp. Hel1_33_131]|uniref:YCF48-related protein n=1 Tax=Formosa sp. Hel1_33_131 TaxID=1336794 RepID=UPI00084E3120|nr:YCF48-related protein [Formosa sp. Hel1_33_131]